MRCMRNGPYMGVWWTKQHKEPLAFVHVLPAGCTRRCDYRYRRSIPRAGARSDDPYLRFSYVGYAPQEMVVCGPSGRT